MAKYDPKSMKAEEFINDGEIRATLAYAEENKNNDELIDAILEKARPRKTAAGCVCAGLTHREASVLLACALKIGAVLADAPKEDAENLYKFGEQMGLAFQLQDDYLDVYGDPKVFGKAVGGDITSNKKTYMLINAFNRANPSQREELLRWTTAKEFDKQEKIAAVTRLYNEMGIGQLAQEKIAYYFEQSRGYLDAVKVAEERKAQLRDFAGKMMKRKY